MYEKTYKCEHCGLDIDRDFNAALNLRNRESDKMDAKLDKEITGVIDDVMDELGFVPSSETTIIITLAVTRGISFGFAKAQKCYDLVFDALKNVRH